VRDPSEIERGIGRIATGSAIEEVGTILDVASDRRRTWTEKWNLERGESVQEHRWLPQKRSRAPLATATELPPFPIRSGLRRFGKSYPGASYVSAGLVGLEPR
jgi:hypothetical protein